MEDLSSFTEAGLKKLTIPQLKVICKEKGISGYSKATKPGIIEKLLVWQSKTSSAGKTSAIVHESAKRSPGNNPCTSSPLTAGSGTGLDSLNGTPPTQSLPTVSPPLTQIPPFEGNRPDGTQKGPPPLSTTPPVSIRTPLPRSITDPVDTRLVITTGTATPHLTSTTLVGLTSSTDGVRRTDNPLKRPLEAEQSEPPPKQLCFSDSARSNVPKGVFQPGKEAPIGNGSTISLPTSKHFKALVPQRIPAPLTGSQNAQHILTPKPPPAIPLPSLGVDVYGHLEFSNEPTVFSLHPISLPPSVAQRKRVPLYALVLSAISSGELKQCVQASRLLRYSAYLSAAHQLAREFPGMRLQKLLASYSPQMTNFWPYLQFRKRERSDRISAYVNSFLFKALSGLCIVSVRLWSSPDHDRQITIALRFLLTKFFFMVSLGYGLERPHLIAGTVLDVHQVIPDEIWEVKFLLPSGLIESYYVLEATCEVVGKIPDAHYRNPDVSATMVRADWLSYIETRKGQQSSTAPALRDHIHWLNHEEYAQGISKIWLANMSAKGEGGRAKIKIAERYIFACVVGNSLNGQWMGRSEMVQTFNGLPSVVPQRPPSVKTLNLFIPVHHHVESVHYTTFQGEPLHPALAIVQTPAREYYILKDNGMQVGTEEEGVASVWMTLLNCTTQGRVYP